MQTNRTGLLPYDSLVNKLIIREIILPVFEFFADIQVSENDLRDGLYDGGAVNRRF